MISLDYLKSRIIGTPLESPVLAAKGYLDSILKRSNPDLALAEKEEEAIPLVMKRFVTPTSNCIDIGCHLGSVLRKLTLLAPSGKHMAFEPTPRKAAWLRRKFPDVEVHEMALGGEAGEVSFFLNETRSGFNSLSLNGDTEVDQFKEIKVPCRRLDELVPPDQKIDFVKIDVEGFELPVIRGAAGLLARDRPAILYESMNFHFERFGYTTRDIYNYLNDDRDYGIYLFTEYLEGAGPLEFERYDACHFYPFRSFNFLAVPKS